MATRGATFEPAQQQQQPNIGAEIASAVQNQRTLSERSRQQQVSETMATKRQQVSAGRLALDTKKFAQDVQKVETDLVEEDSDTDMIQNINERILQYRTTPEMWNTPEGDKFIAELGKDNKLLTFSKYVASNATENQKAINLFSTTTAQARQQSNVAEVDTAMENGTIIQDPTKIDEGIKTKTVMVGGQPVTIDTGEATNARVNVGRALLNAARHDPAELAKLNTNEQFLVATRNEGLSKEWQEAVTASSKQRFATELAQNKSNIDVAEFTQVQALTSVFEELRREGKLTFAQEQAFAQAKGQQLGTIEGQKNKPASVSRVTKEGSFGNEVIDTVKGSQKAVDAVSDSPSRGGVSATDFGPGADSPAAGETTVAPKGLDEIFDDLI